MEPPANDVPVNTTGVPAGIFAVLVTLNTVVEQVLVTIPATDSFNTIACFVLAL